MSEQLPQEITVYVFYIWVAFIVGMIFYVIGLWLRNRGKIMVRVMTGLGPKFYLKKPEVDGITIIMEKASKKTAGWKFTFDQTYQTSYLFGLRHRQQVDVMPYATSQIHYNFATKEVDKPELTQLDVTKIAKAEIFRRRYQEDTNKPQNWFLYIIFVAIIGLYILQFAMSRGVIRL